MESQTPAEQLFLLYSRDHGAVRDLHYWRQLEKRLPARKWRKRRRARNMAAIAHRRCVEAGFDWDALGKPPSRQLVTR